MLSKSGPTPDDLVRRVSKAALVAWARELALPLARGEQVDGQQVGRGGGLWAVTGGGGGGLVGWWVGVGCRFQSHLLGLVPVAGAWVQGCISLGWLGHMKITTARGHKFATLV